MFRREKFVLDRYDKDRIFILFLSIFILSICDIQREEVSL